MTPNPMLAGVVFRRPGDASTEPWDDPEARALVTHLVNLEGEMDVCIPHDLEAEFNHAVTRHDLLAVRTWAQRIKRALKAPGAVA